MPLLAHPFSRNQYAPTVKSTYPLLDPGQDSLFFVSRMRVENEVAQPRKAVYVRDMAKLKILTGSCSGLLSAAIAELIVARTQSLP